MYRVIHRREEVKVLDIGVTRKSRQVGESDIDTFPQRDGLKYGAEGNRWTEPTRRPSMKHVEATTETHVDVNILQESIH